jgi:uncharacterized protein DUF6632
MADNDRLKYLRTALRLVGGLFLFLGFGLMILLIYAWTTWHTGLPHPPETIGIYGTLGAFLLIAARNPLDHLSLIWFTVWSSLVEAAIVIVQAFETPEHFGLGDLPAVLIVVAVLLGASNSARRAGPDSVTYIIIDRTVLEVAFSTPC